jgi:hypothetical protein
MRKLEKVANNHILYDMSQQVTRELEAQTSVADDIAEAANGTNSEGDEIEVFQWWLVSQDFAYAAKKAGEVIVETPFGTLWGRQTCGQPAYQDLNVLDILKNLPAV